MFNNGFNNYYPYQSFGHKSGLFTSLRGKFNWSGILNNTQKTLNIINQAIPVFYQMKPLWNNTKTIFKIMGAIKDDDKKNITKNTNLKNTHNYNSNQNKGKHSSTSVSYDDNSDNSPSFFL